MAEEIKAMVKSTLSHKEKLLLLWETDKYTAITITPLFSIIVLLMNYIMKATFDNTKDYVVSGILIFLIFAILLSIMVSMTGTNKKVKKQIDVTAQEEGIIASHQITEKEKNKAISEKEKNIAKYLALQEKELNKTLELRDKEITHKIAKDKFAMNVHWKQKHYQFSLIAQAGQQIVDEINHNLDSVIHIATNFDLTDKVNAPLVILVEKYSERAYKLTSKHKLLPVRAERSFKQYLDDDDDGEKVNIMEEINDIQLQLNLGLKEIHIIEVPEPDKKTLSDLADISQELCLTNDLGISEDIELTFNDPEIEKLEIEKNKPVFESSGL